MDNYIDDSDALSLLASEIRSLKEEIKRKNIIPPVQKEQKERDLSDIRVAVMAAMRETPRPMASLTKDAEDTQRTLMPSVRIMPLKNWATRILKKHTPLYRAIGVSIRNL